MNFSNQKQSDEIESNDTNTNREVDPLFKHDHYDKYLEMVVDDLTWKTLILHSLRAFHGIRGEASPFDILQKVCQKPQNKVVIRIQKEDNDIFTTSLMNYTFRVDQHLGSLYATKGYLKINRGADYLGLVIDDAYMLDT